MVRVLHMTPVVIKYGVLKHLAQMVCSVSIVNANSPVKHVSANVGTRSMEQTRLLHVNRVAKRLSSWTAVIANIH